ncbi:polysaccharide deacetylase family protein [candidate division KSB1 bacterium]|nr:polysaccharide deacetylase family protein [candidate division KSB1 bacterium]
MYDLLKKPVFYSGLYRISAKIRKKRCCILLYHGIHDSPRPPEHSDKHLALSLFEKHLRYLKRYCHIISLAELIYQPDFPENATLLTFDDGYKNNYTLVYSLLKTYRMPATFFITTGFIDRTLFLWTDQLDYLITYTPLKSLYLTIGNERLALLLHTREDRRQARSQLKRRLKRVPISLQQSLMQELVQKCRVNYGWDTLPENDKPLSWHDVKEMAKNDLITIGSHSVSHPILSRCSLTEQKRELAFSKQRIEQETQRECFAFAYPNGKLGDFNADTIELLIDTGYSAAVTTRVGYVDPQHRDRFLFCRFGASDNVIDFAPLVSGFSHLLHSW